MNCLCFSLNSPETEVTRNSTAWLYSQTRWHSFSNDYRANSLCPQGVYELLDHCLTCVNIWSIGELLRIVRLDRRLDNQVLSFPGAGGKTWGSSPPWFWPAALLLALALALQPLFQAFANAEPLFKPFSLAKPFHPLAWRWWWSGHMAHPALWRTNNLALNHFYTRHI